MSFALWTFTIEIRWFVINGVDWCEMRSLSDTLFFTKVCFHLCVQIITKLQRSFTGCKRGIVIVWCFVLVIRSQILTSRVRSFSLMQAGSFRLDLRHNFSQHLYSKESIVHTMEVVNGCLFVRKGCRWQQWSAMMIWRS